MEEGLSWRMELDGETAGGGAARVDIHPPAECPINLWMQSIRQTADWWCLTQEAKEILSPLKHGLNITRPKGAYFNSLDLMIGCHLTDIIEKLFSLTN